jgi:putative PIG3 family NAD(P)H quinone oxidoreductase
LTLLLSPAIANRSPEIIRGLFMSVPATMRAIEISTPGGPDVLVSALRSVPQPKPDEILIQVHAAGVNRPDVLQRMGMYPVPPGASDLPGLEVAGVVVARGAAADRFKDGTPVVALCNGGGYAEYVCVPEGQVLPLPSGMSMREGAGLCETFFTVWWNVFERAYGADGDSILIHGGSSGIGATALALAREFGLTAYATAGSDEKCRFCITQGAAAAINYRTQDFVSEIRQLTGGRGVDIVLDMIGGEYVPRNMACLADGGRHVSIAVQGGAMATLSVFDIMRKRLTLTGSMLRPQPAEVKAMIAASLENLVWPVLEAGRCLPVIDSVFPLEKAADAHARMETGTHMGKIILEITDAQHHPA